MPFQLIKGEYFVRNSSPDGDSIKFKANDSRVWSSVPGRSIRPNAQDWVQLRVEAVDALETHFKSRPTAYQVKPPEPASERLFNLLGITDVVWDRGGRRVRSASDGTEGFILTRGTGPYGRPIAFLFAGSPPRGAGPDVYLDTALLKQSVNYVLLAEGLVYPLFYDTLFYDLRTCLAEAATKAREENVGIWAEDKSLTGVTVRSESDITGQNPILPKLFRRTVEHFRSGAQTLAGLERRLEREKVTILPQVQITGFDEVVEVSGNRLQMTVPPERIIIGSVMR